MPMQPKGFVGFPDNRMKLVKLPDIFFSDLLPWVDDLGELKLILHCFWLLNEQEGQLKYLRGADLRADEMLLRSLNLASDLRTPQQSLADALERATARGVLLKLEIERSADGGTAVDDWYFINTVKGRQTLALARQGKLEELRRVLPGLSRATLHSSLVSSCASTLLRAVKPMTSGSLTLVEGLPTAALALSKGYVLSKMRRATSAVSSFVVSVAHWVTSSVKSWPSQPR